LFVWQKQKGESTDSPLFFTLASARVAGLGRFHRSILWNLAQLAGDIFGS
jgi:hypothetical protein